MTDKLYKKENGNLVITVPLKQRRSNPYDDSYHPEMDAIVGLYETEFNNGLAYRIDMDYKGKPDQYTDFFFKLNGTKKEYDEMISELGIGTVSFKSVLPKDDVRDERDAWLRGERCNECGEPKERSKTSGMCGECWGDS